MKYVALVIGIIAAGLFLGWLGSGGSSSRVAPLTSDEVRPSNAAPVRPQTPFTAAPQPLPADGRQPPRSEPSPTAAGEMPANETTESDDLVEHLATAAIEDPEKALELLRLFPRLPEATQIEAAHHLSYLLPDAEYSKLDQYLTNAATPEPVLDALLAGLLERKDELKLPTFASVASQERHPRAEEARELLEAFLGEPLDPDKSKWDAQVQQWLEQSRSQMTAEDSAMEDDLPGGSSEP